MWRYVSNCVKTFRGGVHQHVDLRCGVGGASAPPAPGPSKKTLDEPLRPEACEGSSHQHADKNEFDWRACHVYNSWLNAFTWSGAVILGWYASQLACLRHRHRRNALRPRFEDQPKDYCILRSILSSRLALAQPPQSPSVDNADAVDGPLPFRLVKISNDEAPPAPQDDSADFGLVLRSIENRLGIAAVEDGNVRDGLAMIESSARKNYPPAIFNLGLCFEKGLGVEPDEKMAMELYRTAAARNHSGAMYNLAVYYGQGRGGLPRDLEAAGDLMRVAAAKGQKEALAALKVFSDKPTEAKPSEKVDIDDVSSTKSFLNLIGCDKPILLY